MKKMMFNDRYGLTEAVLSGRKTMTRRIVNDKLWDEWTEYDDFCGSVACGDIPTTRQYYHENGFFLVRTPFKIGEVVAVAQAYNDFYNDECDPRMFPDGAGWTNKMFVRADLMPHQIRITNVRAEKLQDISDEDCFKEGICASNSHEIGYGIPWVYSFDGTNMAYYTPREAYAALIDKVSGKGTWDSNPFVFVYEFELVK